MGTVRKRNIISPLAYPLSTHLHDHIIQFLAMRGGKL